MTLWSYLDYWPSLHDQILTVIICGIRERTLDNESKIWVLVLLSSVTHLGDPWIGSISSSLKLGQDSSPCFAGVLGGSGDEVTKDGWRPWNRSGLVVNSSQEPECWVQIPALLLTDSVTVDTSALDLVSSLQGCCAARWVGLRQSLEQHPAHCNLQRSTCYYFLHPQEEHTAVLGLHRGLRGQQHRTWSCPPELYRKRGSCKCRSSRGAPGGCMVERQLRSKLGAGMRQFQGWLQREGAPWDVPQRSVDDRQPWEVREEEGPPGSRNHGLGMACYCCLWYQICKSVWFYSLSSQSCKSIKCL